MNLEEEVKKLAKLVVKQAEENRELKRQLTVKPVLKRVICA